MQFEEIRRDSRIQNIEGALGSRLERREVGGLLLRWRELGGFRLGWKEFVCSRLQSMMQPTWFRRGSKVQITEGALPFQDRTGDPWQIQARTEEIDSSRQGCTQDFVKDGGEPRPGQKPTYPKI